MILHMVAVRDTATEAFHRPFFVAHPAQAVRSFGDECNNPESEICKHAVDYELWSVGTFDDGTGVLVDNPVRLVRAQDLKKG